MINIFMFLVILFLLLVVCFVNIAFGSVNDSPLLANDFVEMCNQKNFSIQNIGGFCFWEMKITICDFYESSLLQLFHLVRYLQWMNAEYRNFVRWICYVPQCLLMYNSSLRHVTNVHIIISNKVIKQCLSCLQNLTELISWIYSKDKKRFCDTPHCYFPRK